MSALKMFINSNSVITDLKLVREKKPLVHNVTNFVTMNWVANGLLSLGASPVMAHAPEEVADLVHISQALVLNIGTLDTEWINSMKIALDAASECNIPVVLDPVGAGATQFRTNTAHDLLSQGGVTVIRGNASEICALAGERPTTKGVDSSLLPNEAYDAAKKLHEQFGCVVVASGPEDLILGPGQQIRVYNGTSMMSRVTGMGCLSSSIVAAFCAVQSNPTHAAAHAMAYSGIAGERASAGSPGPGSYAVSYLNLLSDLQEEWIARSLTVECYASNF